MFQVINEKALCGKDFKRNLRDIFIYENNLNSCKFSYKFAFVPFLFFRRKKKQELNFQQVEGLLTRKLSVFCL